MGGGCHGRLLAEGADAAAGLGFNAVSAKALAAAKNARFTKSYWSWEEMLAANKGGFFPSTPSTNLLYGLREALRLLREEGLEAVFARHQRHGEATRRAVRTWGLDILCLNPEEYSPVLTAVVMPEGQGADAFRAAVLEKFNMSLGNGLGILKDRVFRIGHLGDFNDLTLIGTLGGRGDGLRADGRSPQEGGRRGGDGLPGDPVKRR